MRPAHPTELTAEERRTQLAAILAVGLARLRRRATPPADSRPAESAEILSSALESDPETSVTVHTG